MGAMVGLVIGYVIGTRAGEQGWSELRSAWTTIKTSEEVRDMISGGVSMAGDLVQRGTTMLAERLQQPAPKAKLRRVA